MELPWLSFRPISRQVGATSITLRLRICNECTRFKTVREELLGWREAPGYSAKTGHHVGQQLPLRTSSTDPTAETYLSIDDAPVDLPRGSSEL